MFILKWYNMDWSWLIWINPITNWVQHTPMIDVPFGYKKLPAWEIYPIFKQICGFEEVQVGGFCQKILWEIAVKSPNQRKKWSAFASKTLGVHWTKVLEPTEISQCRSVAVSWGAWPSMPLTFLKDSWTMSCCCLGHTKHVSHLFRWFNWIIMANTCL